MREIELRVTEVVAEPLSDALLAAGALSVTVTDADADSEHESALFGEPGHAPVSHAWASNVVVALFAADVDPLDAFRAAWEALDLAAPAPALSIRDVPSADWVRLTQAQFEPVRIGARLWIVPSWHAPPVADAINVRLDPGVAFGTGTHPTTRLCLSWL